MKKLYVLILVLLLSACSSKDPITKYLKEDIIIEAGNKVELKDLVNENEIKDENLKKALSVAKVDFDTKNNKNINKKDIKEDKIYATNEIEVLYKYKDKDYKTPITISLKDTKKPNVDLQQDYYFSQINKSKSKEDFIKELKVDIKDNSSYEIDIPDYDKVDYSKVQENELKLNISDEANNIVTKDITLFIGNNPQTITFKLNTEYFGNNYKYKNFNIVLPSSITSKYKVSQRTVDIEHYIYLSNEKEKIEVVVPNPYVTGYINAELIDNYSINKFDIHIFNSNSNYIITSWLKNKDGIGLFSHTKKKSQQRTVKWIVDTITANSYLN